MTTRDRKAATRERDAPAYTIAEAARYLRLPSATLRSWVLGRQYPTSEGHAEFPPLIRPASQRPPLLSFLNLIEAHVLRALRTDHGVPVKAVRGALAYAEKRLQIDRLLLRPELRADAGRIFLDRYGELIELSASGQFAMRRLFSEHLKRVEWDASRFPERIYPFLPAAVRGEHHAIAIDPRIAFDRPFLLDKGVSTATITERIDAGELPDDVAADCDLQPAEIEEAVLYERAA